MADFYCFRSFTDGVVMDSIGLEDVQGNPAKHNIKNFGLFVKDQ